MGKVKIYVSFNLVEGDHTEVEESRNFKSYRELYDYIAFILPPLGFLTSIEEFENEEEKEKKSYQSFCKQRRNKTVKNAYKPS